MATFSATPTELKQLIRYLSVEATKVRGNGAAVTDDQVIALYERTVESVYSYAARLCGHDRATAEEIVQETFLTLVRTVRAGGVGNYDLPWLIVVCRSRFLDRLRSDQRRIDRQEVVARLAPSMWRQTEEIAEDGRDSAVAAQLAELPGEQRVALVLRYVDEMSVPEVAKTLSRSVHATESLLARGRAGLRRKSEQGVDR